MFLELESYLFSSIKVWLIISSSTQTQFLSTTGSYVVVSHCCRNLSRRLHRHHRSAWTGSPSSMDATFLHHEILLFFPPSRARVSRSSSFSCWTKVVAVGRNANARPPWGMDGWLSKGWPIGWVAHPLIGKGEKPVVWREEERLTHFQKGKGDMTHRYQPKKN